MFATILCCLIACCAIMAGVWRWAKPIQNTGMAEIFWAVDLAMIALILYAAAPGWLPRKSLLCTMVLFAGLRLGSHLSFRVANRLHGEGGWYRRYRKAWYPYSQQNFFWLYQAQAICNVVLAIPFFIICANTRRVWSGFEIAGTVLWVIAFLGESLADHQLSAFKKVAGNRGKVLSTGLWGYSRHPNYFFEWLQWMAWFLFSLGSPYGGLAVISPLIILWLLFKVTGIPNVEEQCVRSKGERYKNYQREVSAFLPWFKKQPRTNLVWYNTLLENSRIPDPVLRLGIRLLLRQRLREEAKETGEMQQAHFSALLRQLKASPIAVSTTRPNGQQQELPARFFEYCLGRHLNYSCGYWLPGTGRGDLDTAEKNMLELTCRRAGLRDGQDILELGCGWGSLSLFMAERYPNSRIMAISNSPAQKDFIDNRIGLMDLTNLQVVTADINDFELPAAGFDRVVSVEMFEHMRNYQLLLKKIAAALRPDGKLFVQLFAHKQCAYLFENKLEAAWLGRHFFTAGIMPSADLLLYFNEDLAVEEHWQVDGTHYSKTATAWLNKMDYHKAYILPLFKKTYGEADAAKWWARWRLFYLACAELWNYNHGREWIVSHYLFHKNVLPASTSLRASPATTASAE
jgi:cyclopropane-fatty-acyl-phospholipid synthase